MAEPHVPGTSPLLGEESPQHAQSSMGGRVQTYEPGLLGSAWGVPPAGQATVGQAQFSKQPTRPCLCLMKLMRMSFLHHSGLSSRTTTSLKPALTSRLSPLAGTDVLARTPPAISVLALSDTEGSVPSFLGLQCPGWPGTCGCPADPEEGTGVTQAKSGLQFPQQIHVVVLALWGLWIHERIHMPTRVSQALTVPPGTHSWAPKGREAYWKGPLPG